MEYQITLTREELDVVMFALHRNVERAKDSCIKWKNIIAGQKDDLFEDEVENISFEMYKDSIEDLNNACEVYEKFKKEVKMIRDE